MIKNSKNGIKEVKDHCLELHKGNDIDSRLCVITDEFRSGFELLKKYPKSVTIFGSARLDENNPHAKNATELAMQLAKLGYTITTGGGHGIMGAAHKGSSMVNGTSVGINIELPFEQTMNQYITDYLEFHHFFSRKVILAYSAEAYICFAGGFGTLDEFFEILTLKQTKKIPSIPIILFGSEFWNPLQEFIKKILLEKNKTISDEDLNLYIITDDINEVINIVESSPIRAEA